MEFNLLLSAYTEFHIGYLQIPTTQIPLCDMVAEGQWFNCNITQVLCNLFSEYNQLASSILFYSSIAKRLPIDWLQNLYPQIRWQLFVNLHQSESDWVSPSQAVIVWKQIASDTVICVIVMYLNVQAWNSL